MQSATRNGNQVGMQQPVQLLITGPCPHHLSAAGCGEGVQQAALRRQDRQRAGEGGAAAEGWGRMGGQRLSLLLAGMLRFISLHEACGCPVARVVS